MMLVKKRRVVVPFWYRRCSLDDEYDIVVLIKDKGDVDVRKTKYRLETFQLYDYSGIEEHLTKMARKGWILEKVGALAWKYRRIEPQELEFSITYYPEASVYDPGPTASQERLYDICEEMGWTFVGEWWQMQIFSRPVAIASGDSKTAGNSALRTPLETDPEVKLANIQRTMRRSGGAGNIVTLMTIPLFLLMMYMKKDTIERLTDAYTIFALGEYVLIAAYALINLGFYSAWHRKAIIAAEQGEDLPPVSGGYRIAAWICLILMFGSMFFWMRYFGKALNYIVGGLVLACTFVNVFFAERIRNNLKRHGVSREKNRRTTLASIMIMGLITTVVMTSVLVFGVTRHWFREGSQPTEYVTTAINGSTWTWDVYHDDIPLEIEDLMEVDYEHYSKERRRDNESLFAHHVRFIQNGFPDRQDPPEMEYEILDTKLFYEACLNDMLESETKLGGEPFGDRRFSDEGLEPLEKLWNADKVYQLIRDDGPRELYVISWTKTNGGNDRIAKIEFSWEPTEEQLKLAGEVLRSAEL